MSQKWNLQDIRPTSPRPRTDPAPQDIIERPASRPLERSELSSDDNEVGTITIENGRRRRRRGWIVAFLVFFLVLGGGVIFSILTTGANLTVYPRHREPNVNATFTAYHEPKAGELSYELMTLEAEGERQVKASGQEEAKKQAEGTIFIYNAFQDKPLRLITNTRFESADGLIFRIKDATIVPGYTKDDAGQIVPGVITATVFADQPGEKYNLAPGRFTVPGFKGEPEFDKIYAESTEAFSGGFEGQRFIIAEDDTKTAEQALRTELRNSLLERIGSEKPAGFAVFNDAVTFSYETLPAVAYGDNLATLKEKVTMRLPIFKDEDFASYIAKATIPGYDGAPVRIADTSVLTFAFKDATTTASDLSTIPSFEFTLAGRPQIIWTYDAEKFKSDLVSKSKTALPVVLGAYPGIESAEAKIRPFWKSKFPLQISKITITETLK